jgi:hypothetical protein
MADACGVLPQGGVSDCIVRPRHRGEKMMLCPECHFGVEYEGNILKADATLKIATACDFPVVRGYRY